MSERKPKLKPIGAWAEMSPEGELLFCYGGRKYGKKFEEKLTLKEIEQFIIDFLRKSKKS